MNEGSKELLDALKTFFAPTLSHRRDAKSARRTTKPAQLSPKPRPS